MGHRKSQQVTQKPAFGSAIIKLSEMEIHDPASALADTAVMLQAKSKALSEPSPAMSSLESSFAWHKTPY